MATRLVAGSACFVAAVLAGAAVPARAQCYGLWVQAELGSQYAHAMTYDSLRGRVIVQCTPRGAGGSGGTWAWDGTDWTRLAWDGPWPLRTGCRIAYDPNRDRVVLFGGSGKRRDTWEFDGTHWRLVADDGPPGREDGQLVFFPPRGTTLLLGGFGLTADQANDLWEWDGVRWSQLAAANPPPLGENNRPSLAYDSLRQRVLCVPGVYGTALGTYAFDGAQWTQLTSSSPFMYSGSFFAYDQARDRAVYVSGQPGFGQFCPSSDKIVEFNGVAWGNPGPVLGGNRAGAAMAYSAKRQRCVIFGGGNCNAQYSETLEWNGTAVTLWPDPRPVWRQTSGATFDAALGKTVVYGGGYTVPGVAPLDMEIYYHDTWEWSPAGWINVTGSSALDRKRHSMAFDPVQNRTILFGGKQIPIDDKRYTWSFTGLWTDLNASAPDLTFSDNNVYNALSHDPGRGRLVLMGPETSTSSTGVWEWVGDQWLHLTPQGGAPSKRYNMASAYDPVRGETLMFGGGSSPYLNDTWSWNGQAWTQLSPSGTLPGPRAGHSMATDVDRSAVMLAGGSSSGDTWEWNGAQWNQVGVNGPAPTGLSLVYDSWIGATLMFCWDTMWQWIEPQPPIFVDSPHDTDFYVGETAMLECTTEQVGPVTFQWRKDGVPVVDDGRIRGSHTMRLVFESATIDDRGCYDVVCTGGCGSVTSEVGCLGVFCPADYYQDGFVNGVDFDYFVDLFYWGDPGADFDNNGFVNGVDFDSFIEAFVAGC